MSIISHARRRSLTALALAALAPTPALASPPNVLVNPGAETLDLTGWTSGGTSNPGVDNGTFDPGLNPLFGNADFYGGTGASGTLTQTITLTGFAPTFQEIDDASQPAASRPSASVIFFEQSLDQGTSDAAGVNLSLLNAAGTTLSQSTSGAFAFPNQWAPASFFSTLDSGTRKVQYQMFFTRHSGSDIDSFIDGNSLVISHPGSAWTSSAGTSWQNPAFWDTGVPSSGAPALLTSAGNGASVNLDSDYSGAPLTELYVDAAVTSMTLSQSAHTMNATTQYIGNVGTGSYVQSGGANIASALYIGYFPGSIGSYSISNGTLSTGTLALGYSGFGSLSISGSASVTLSNELDLDQTGAGGATLTISGGSLIAPFVTLNKGSTFTISGGFVDSAADFVVDNTSATLLTLSGGTLAVNALDLNGAPSHFSWTSGELEFLSPITINSSFFLGSSITLANGKILAATTLSNNGTVALNSTNSALNAETLLNAANASISGTGSINIFSNTPSSNAGLLSISGTFLSNADFSNSGNFSLSGTQTWVSGRTFTNSSNATFSTDTGSSSTSPLNVVNASGTLHFHATQHLKSLTLNAGTAFIEAGTVKTNTFSIAGSTNNWSATLNIAANKLIIQAAPDKTAAIATLQNQITFGRSHSTGITSSSLPPNTALAVLDNAITQFTTFGSQPVDANSILIAPELLGDANADGHVDLTDLSTILNNFGTSTSAWTSGNFDNATTIDLTDLSDVLNNFGLINASAFDLPASAQPALPTPEPGFLAGFLALFALTFIARNPHLRRPYRRNPH